MKYKSGLLTFLFVLVATMFAGCGSPTTPAPKPTLTPTPSMFSYFIHIQDRRTGKDIENAQVILYAGGSAPFDGISDSRGVVRVEVRSDFIAKPGRLVVDAIGYKKYSKNMDFVAGNLPEEILLEAVSSLPTPTLTPSATQTPTEAPVPLPTNTPLPPPTFTSTATATASPTSTPTPISTPTPDPTNITTATATAIATATTTPLPTPTAPAVSGKIAVPLMLGNQPKVYIVDVVTGQKVGDLGNARQPAYTVGGTKLIVNGDGGGLDKLRISGPVGNNWREIGDAALAGHSHPSWSPDGTQVIYDDNTAGCRGYCMFTRTLTDKSGPGQQVNASGGIIVDQNSLHPLWAVDDRLIFRSCNTWVPAGGSQCGLWLMAGGVPEILLDGDANPIPTDVHGDWLVYNDNSAGNWDVWALNLSTREKRQLSTSTFNDGLSTISPDGNYVAFLSNREGWAVWAVDFAGGGLRRLFNIPSEWGQLRTDGWAEEKLAWGK